MASTYPHAVNQPPGRGVGHHNDQPTGLSQTVTQCIEDRPDEAILISLLSGLAVGVALGMALAGPRESKSWRDRRTAEDLGSRLLSSIEQVLPDSIARSVGMK